MSKLGKILEDTFAEVAFAECGVESGLPQANVKEKREGASVRQWLDNTGAAVAFAQAGDHETAVEMTKSQAEKQAPTEGPLVLVIGGEKSFSDELVSYAVDMADRMKSAILALNIGTSADASCAAAFAKAAGDAGVSFSHEIRHGHKDQIVEALSNEHPNLQYVMTEPARPTAKSIPVYCPSPAVRARARATTRM